MSRYSLCCTARTHGRRTIPEPHGPDSPALRNFEHIPPSNASCSGRRRDMTANPVNWFEIYVQDTARAKTFYETVFEVGLERLEAPGPGVSEMWMFPSEQKAAGATGALVKMPGGPSNGNSVIVYFSCDDCAVEAKRVPAAGGKIMKDKFSIGQYGFIALVDDTEGNVIGLHSMR
jgi:predicted enzyme related to lactoylglutathione lyase